MDPYHDRNFVIIGENIHTSREVLRKGKRVIEADGATAVSYTAEDGTARQLSIPDAVKTTQEYDEGRVKHVKIAIQAAMSGEGAHAAEGMAYLRALVRGQERGGADILDLNVDEISLRRENQKMAMAWLVRAVQAASQLPVSVDSSSMEVIEAGLEACDSRAARPLLNSASLERIDALDLGLTHNARIIATAAGDTGMPDGSAERVANASRIVETALEKGFAPEDVYIDPLVFPISIDRAYGVHCLDAIRELRAKFGPDIHITGGVSNVSFGIPSRRLINEMFLILAVEAGADSGIIDPVTIRPSEVLAIDRASGPYKLAEDVLLGREDSLAYIQAWRRGELHGAARPT